MIFDEKCMTSHLSALPYKLLMLTPAKALAGITAASQALPEKGGRSPSVEGSAVMRLAQPLGQHRSPLPICSPPHAYVAGQTSPPGALGTRLRDLEPKQVLPALRALW